MGIPTKAQLLQAAKVYGLGGDVLGDVDKRSGMHKIIFQSEFNLAIVCRLEIVHRHRASGVFTLGDSTVAIHNGRGEPREFLDWEKQLTLLQRKSDGTLETQMKLLRDKEYCKHFRLEGATFAGTELNAIPERIFLFVKQDGFDMEQIIELLRVHRILNPQPHLRDLSFIYSYWR